ncbi:cysteine peptidase family C39 domain-containing protein [Pedobacter sp. L105]|uniref:cysteine peptidase family C39 domain-containing protein n=1 Tax=Pedobacter sp. L105 TaxID=1641871 RepID=UPI00131C8AF8|nr:cysteine peptidase family C39 domain-containing protein [Pedobacter sp. L105]
MPKNIESCALLLINLLKLPISANQIVHELDIHPDYPSLLALSDVFTYLKIKNSAYQINSNEIQEVSVPFIAYTKTAGSEFLVVETVNEQTVTISNENYKSKRLSISEFSKLFDNIVLTIEDGDEVVSKKTPIKPSFQNSVSNPAFLVLLAVIFIAQIITNTNYSHTLSWQIVSLILLKTAGLTTAVLLLIQSLDSDNLLVKAVCAAGGKTNCNAILSSQAAQAFLGLTWSEVGFFYFAGTWLALLFNSQSINILQCLAILNILSLPYTIYSIYYQARIAREWCILCCTIQALLWLEFIPLVSYFQLPLHFPGSITVINLLTCLLLPATIWQITKPLFKKLQELPEIKSQLRKFRYNSELFNNALKKQPKYALPDQEWSIVLGNMDAEEIITMVSNPQCNPCSKMHRQLEEWLSYRDDLQVRIVFTSKNNDNNLNTSIVRHLMALNELEDKSIIANALRDWHSGKKKNYADWSKAYPVNLDPANYCKLEKQHEWCKMINVKHTPTMLINGRQIPDLYTSLNLKYMLL